MYSLKILLYLVKGNTSSYSQMLMVNLPYYFQVPTIDSLIQVMIILRY